LNITYSTPSTPGNGAITIAYTSIPTVKPTISPTGFQVQRIFNFTGYPQSFKVPFGITSLMLLVAGASGGNQQGLCTVGYGARVTTTLTVTPGDVLFVVVGGKGVDKSTAGTTMVLNGGYNGGGKSAGKVRYVNI
jgi:hypothetical protein